jgi:hypothetical protein
MPMLRIDSDGQRTAAITVSDRYDLGGGIDESADWSPSEPRK